MMLLREKPVILIFMIVFLSNIVLCHNEKNFVSLGYPHYAPGFFSIFLSVLGALKEYEAGKIDGIEVSLQKGYYLEPSRGENWWEYYFEPITAGVTDNNIKVPLSDKQIADYAMLGLFSTTRVQGSQLIKKYIKVKTPLQEKVQNFVDTYFQHCFIIGVHYRGTDKVAEAPRVSYQDFYIAIQQIIDTLSGQPYRIFVATDEQPFIDFMDRMFDHVIYQDIRRSSNSQSLHQTHPNPYKSGEDCLVDCLLLARCDTMVRGRSNLSNIVSKFNPGMPILHLGKSDLEILANIEETY